MRNLSINTGETVAVLQVLAVALLLAKPAFADTPPTAAELVVERLASIEEPLGSSEFHAWVSSNLPTIDTDAAWTVVSAALEHRDEEIVVVGLMSVPFIFASREMSGVEAPIQQITLLAESPSADIRIYARRALDALEADSAAAEAWLVRMLQEEEDESAAVDLIRVLARNGIETRVAEQSLLAIAAGHHDRIGHRAISVMTYQKIPPAEALPLLMKFVISEEYFADPNLVQAIPRFGATAVDYLAELRRLQGVLGAQLALPESERGVEIFNDAFYGEQMEIAIAAISSME